MIQELVIRSPLFQWQTDGKRRTGSRAALQGNSPTMGLDGMLYYRQAKTATTGISRPILVNTIKALEKVRLVAKWHTRPIVMHSYDHFPPVAVSFDNHVDTELTPVLKRIINEIVDHLLNPERICFNPRQTPSDVNFYFCRDLANVGVQALHNPLNTLPHLDRLKI